MVDSRLSLQSTMIPGLSLVVFSVQLHDFGQALDPETAAITIVINSSSLQANSAIFFLRYSTF